MDLGKPEHTPFCGICSRDVGGAYFSAFEALERLREHKANVHDFYGWHGTKHQRAAKPRQVIATFIDQGWGNDLSRMLNRQTHGL